MLLSLNTIVQAAPALGKLNATDLPIASAFRLRKMSSQLQDALTLFEERRKAAFEDHAIEDDEGKQSVPSECDEAFQSAMKLILDTELDINEETFTLAELEGATLTGSELNTIVWLIADTDI